MRQREEQSLDEEDPTDLCGKHPAGKEEEGPGHENLGDQIKHKDPGLSLIEEEEQQQLHETLQYITIEKGAMSVPNLEGAGPS